MIGTTARPVAGKADTVDHIADMTRELAGLARVHPDLDLLAYLLDMVRLEATSQAGRATDASGQVLAEREAACRMPVDKARKFKLD